MKVKTFIENLFKEWPVKVVCLVAAILLYLLFQSSTLDSKVFTVPLKIDSRNGIVACDTYPSSVKLTLRGRSEDLSRLREADFTAFLDLNYLSKEGVYKLPVQLNRSEQAMILTPLEIKVHPALIELKVEEQISGFVPVTPLVSGNPAHGYDVKEILISPKEIEVKGPRSMVEGCKRLQTQPVNISGSSQDVSRAVGVENTGLFIKPVNTDKIIVTVNIEKSTSSRRFDRLTANPINVDPLLTVSSIVDEVSVTLNGNTLDLEKFIAPSYMILADCKNVHEEGLHEVPISILAPDSFSISPDTPVSVQIMFEKKFVPEISENDEVINTEEAEEEKREEMSADESSGESSQ